MPNDAPVRLGIEPTPAMLRLLRPWHVLTSPRLYGLENVPEKGPSLFVGNHTIFGIIDVPVMQAELWGAKRIWLRGLAERAHWSVPGWRDFAESFGAVVASRRNCAALLDGGEHVLVFPGGTREAMKSKGEAYTLLWKERVGFARMAIAHGSRIVPFSAVGAEETYRILLDRDHPLGAPVRAVVQRLTGNQDLVLPVVAGIGVLPRPQRFYFRFGKPIETAAYAGREDDPTALAEVREATRTAIEDGITDLLARREADPHRELLPRAIDALRDLAPLEREAAR